ncbi:heavy metal translocating P-type ATPase metal-binding domain-containing protein [Parapedobacter sp. ISTM3]|uniref:heavy metal translocating P-type ATPase n=1 Tax=Parapedobacter sp. ISTM3 TaxID=2800130 RepID=UPI001906CF5E|nr:heavy metal translocating P-type ATPase metal-binding domain-containing protein [Parapedobacter sp. ISTM3]MBK1439588.1 heavy metal translocating P-type ATPase metal-binding domain-containing protein [Parapedobacter sp. ISTM3]
MKIGTKTSNSTKCYHCGDTLAGTVYEADGHVFCCVGCQSVYRILSSNNMQQYYRYNTHPGKKLRERSERYEYLDEPTIADKLIDFKNDEITMATFYIPSIHCSSCIWLLEHLYKLHPAVVASQSDFLKKQVNVTFKHPDLSLRELVELLANVGYEPKITLQDVVKAGRKFSQKGLIAKIAVAGFCFGNSMMLSFPEYFGMAAFEAKYSMFFGWMNLGFALPVLLYSGRDYFQSAWHSLRHRQLNLDVPLALGILVLFVRTAWEILSATGPGFADTLCGLVFFLLVGRWVQQRTYHHLSFERDYRSYFPVAVTRLGAANAKPVPLAEISVGDRLLIRSNEVIPADAILLKGQAAIDFSFVTGESEPVEKVLGEIIYAGGRQLGEAIELEVVKPVSQSYLTKLWNNDAFKQYEKRFRTFSNVVSQYFTLVLLAIAITAMAYWFLRDDPAKAWGAFTAVLIIACPCALALSTPFTLSVALRVFDRHGFYVKNTAAVEQLAAVDCLVFDKTGTISSPSAARMRFEGQLQAGELAMVVSVCQNSNHPLSRELVKWAGPMELMPIGNYQETGGKGIEAEVHSNRVRIGSAAFTGARDAAGASSTGSRIYIAINNEVKGFFIVEQPWREGLREVMGELAKPYDLHLVSGDNAKERKRLREIFPPDADLLFGKLPAQKLEYINKLQHTGSKVCMFGDGLNDAGALRQADLGIAVSDDINNFSPGCDAILDGRSFVLLPRFLRFAKDAVKVIHMSFGISLTYNVIGLSFAVMGTMSPLFAAVLMPLSTVTIIGFTTVVAHAYAAKNQLNNIRS